MQCKIDPFSGVVHYEKDDALTFYAEDYHFSFLSTSLRSFDSLFERDTANDTLISAPDGFIYGVTHDNHEIAVFSGDNPFVVNGTNRLHTSLFLISKGNLCHKSTDYNAILFSGGTLNSLFTPKGLLRTKEDKEQISYARNNDALSYTFHVEGAVYTVCIFSMVHEMNSFNGRRLENTEVCLRISFDTPQTISELQKHCHNIYTLIRFMTHRQNVDFDSISLQQNNKKGQYESSYSVYISNNEPPTTKKITTNITFDDLQNHIAPLLQKIYSKDFIRLNFIPINDRDINYMSDAKIKTLCTALECIAPEIPNENISLTELVELVKSEIKRYRNDHPNAITNNTYSLIHGSIDHWTASAAERVWALCCQHYDLQKLSNTLFNNEQIFSQENVRAVIQYRNKSTHSSAFALDDNTARTALLLDGVVYCSILDSIGMTDEEISNLCEQLKIST